MWCTPLEHNASRFDAKRPSCRYLTPRPAIAVQGSGWTMLRGGGVVKPLPQDVDKLELGFLQSTRYTGSLPNLPVHYFAIVPSVRILNSGYSYAPRASMWHEAIRGKPDSLGAP